MRACKFFNKQSMDARKQMAVHRADINATINQQRNQQKWVVVVVEIATATAAATTATTATMATTATTATTATRRRGGNAMETVMDGDGRRWTVRQQQDSGDGD